MEIPEATSDRIYKTLQKAQKIAIISHRHPDPDTLCSNLALRVLLEKMGKDVTSACVDPVPENCLFLPELKTFVDDFDPKDFDLFISVDAGSTAQAAFPEKYPSILKKNFINIDHHPSNDHYGTLPLVMEDAASTTLIIYELFGMWNEEITIETATFLLFGLYFDTGSFMHSNTDAGVYKIASELMRKGARQDLIVQNLFKKHSIEKLKLWGKALDSAQLTDNRVIVAGVTAQEFSDCRATSSDLGGLIDYLSTAKESKFATLLSGDDSGQIKGSLRTRHDNIDVSRIARDLGGGGHKKASGFSIKGNLKRKTHWSITDKNPL
ncbi:bifunctional oligoribonuclease/PAP phosphatase NrnA [Patescibacteria group bacterium]|nr:bifunctional oligoribonuclease/PAP phosphatase NrnA [Patescibacteria group bacterium]MBU1703178.1 bifunctional oligoribonuclease/PAP phosphatase NrnA [Patescibacteria group bacterium]MBU1953974.1 bifunctional oligoribonuclease/PAP phosphatase NrnA [Patescibacteria group bacterium]